MSSIPALASFVLCGVLAAQNHVCTVTAAGSGCAALTVTLTPQGNGGANDLTLHASGLHPQSFGGMVWGMTPITGLLLPFGSCPLLTDFVWGHYFQTDAAGEYDWSRSWPGSFDGYFYMQMGSVFVNAAGDADVRSTDCWLVQCLRP